MPTEIGRLNDKLAVALASNPYLAGRLVNAVAIDDRVVLTGTVATYFQKQMAQESIRMVDGVGSIENDVEVTWA